jgi:protein gp37
MRVRNGIGTGLPYKPGHRKDVEIFLDEKMLMDPLHWRRARMVFSCSMTDLFADFVKDEWIDRMFAIKALCPGHTFQCLTKRPERMSVYCNALDVSDRATVMKALRVVLSQQRWSKRKVWLEAITRPLPNCWLGVSVERQQEADERIPLLLQTPAAVRWLSVEPLLAPVGELDLTGIDWCVAGGESGRFYRPMKLEWAREVFDQCRGAGVAFFMK